MQRRQILRWMGFGALSAGFSAEQAISAWAAVRQAGPASLRFFTPAEEQLVDDLMERIIPADGHSPGAHSAQVSLFADWMLATGGETDRLAWRAGLGLFHQRATATSVAEALAEAARGEAHPETDLEHFFVRLKGMTVNGYYTSSIGIHQDLQYQGNTFVASFPGCPNG